MLTPATWAHLLIPLVGRYNFNNDTLEDFEKEAKIVRSVYSIYWILVHASKPAIP